MRRPTSARLFASPCSRRSRGGRRRATTARGSSSPRCSPRGWSRAGHDVTLFATADSVTTATLAGTSPRGWSEDDSIDPKVAECLHIAVAVRAGRRVRHHPQRLRLPAADLQRPRRHARRDDDPRLLLAPHRRRLRALRRDDDVRRDQRRRPPPPPALRRHDPPRHRHRRVRGCRRPGRPPAVLRPHPPRQGHGRRDRGRPPRRAAARHRRHHPGRARTSTTQVAPHVDGDRVRYLGPVDAADRVRVLGGAHALLHLIDFDEPFGYSVVEAMACGTPVIAYRPRVDAGARSTTARPASSSRTSTRAVDAVGAAAALDRATIRATAVDRFDVAAMVDRYVAVYRAIRPVRNKSGKSFGQGSVRAGLARSAIMSG